MIAVTSSNGAGLWIFLLTVMCAILCEFCRFIVTSRLNMWVERQLGRTLVDLLRKGLKRAQIFSQDCLKRLLRRKAVVKNVGLEIPSNAECIKILNPTQGMRVDSEPVVV